MVHRFKDEWLEEDSLKEWLVKVSNDESRAYCRYCAIVLRAHKTDLTAHAATIKHTTNVRLAADSGVSTGAISVQIVSNENEEDANANNNSQELKQEVGNSGEYEGDNGTTKTPKTSAGSRRSGGGPTYTKRYRPEWEQDAELKAWLQEYTEDSSKAYCKVCQVVLRAHKHDLVLHARSAKHKKRSEVLGYTNPEDSNDGDINTYEMVSVESFDEGSPSKRIKQSVSSDDEIDANGGDLVTGMDSDEVKGSETPTQVLKVKDYKSKKPVSLFSPGRKRSKINAADVVLAIENNEFTGYELLQIVKRAVPKL